MLKKLRNKMLIMNTVSTFLLVIFAFTVVFATMYTNTQRHIKENVFRAFVIHRPVPSQFPGNGEVRQRPATMPDGEEQRILRDMKSFSVYVDENMNVITDSIFGENSEHYESVAKAALAQNKSDGEFKSEGIVWHFETRKLDSGARIMALVDITAEKSFLVGLIIILVVCAAVLLVLIFLASLHFANKAIAPVKESWEKQKQFVADASHELRTPLTAINANIDVLLTDNEATENNAKWLRYVKAEVSRLNDLTANLLLLARSDSEAAVEMQEESISEIFTRTVLNFEVIAYEKGVNFECNIEENVMCRCNAAQIAQISVILIDNAIKYSAENGNVTLKLFKSSHNEIVIKIHNDGESISPEEKEKIFDRFYRADKSRSSSGFGLGLAMASEIVKIHKGKIDVTSSENFGTEFTVILPA